MAVAPGGGATAWSLIYPRCGVRRFRSRRLHLLQCLFDREQVIGAKVERARLANGDGIKKSAKVGEEIVIAQADRGATENKRLLVVPFPPSVWNGVRVP